jgi:thioredoxin 1
LSTTIQHVVQVIYRKTHVVNARTAFGDIFPNRSVLRDTLEEFNQGFPAGDTGDVGSIGIVQGYDWHLENVSQERKQFVDGSQGYANVSDAGTTAVRFRHIDQSVCLVYEVSILFSREQLETLGCATEQTMANAVEVTDDNFATEVEGNQGLTVVDFWATWCAPCRMIAPMVEQLASDYSGKVRVGKLDVDSNQKTAMRFNVRSIPTILFFKDGKLVDQVVGAVPKPALEAKFKEHA